MAPWRCSKTPVPRWGRCDATWRSGSQPGGILRLKSTEENLPPPPATEPNGPSEAHPFRSQSVETLKRTCRNTGTWGEPHKHPPSPAPASAGGATLGTADQRRLVQQEGDHRGTETLGGNGEGGGNVTAPSHSGSGRPLQTGERKLVLHRPAPARGHAQMGQRRGAVLDSESEETPNGSEKSGPQEVAAPSPNKKPSRGRGGVFPGWAARG